MLFKFKIKIQKAKRKLKEYIGRIKQTGVMNIVKKFLILCGVIFLSILTIGYYVIYLVGYSRGIKRGKREMKLTVKPKGQNVKIRNTETKVLKVEI